MNNAVSRLGMLTAQHVVSDTANHTEWHPVDVVDVAIQMSLALDECMAMTTVNNAHRQWTFVIRIMNIVRSAQMSIPQLDEVVSAIHLLEV